MYYLKLFFLFVAIAVVHTLVSRLLGLNDLINKGKFGELGAIAYDMVTLVSGGIIGILVSKNNV